jgi:hypothetical protein
VPPGEVSAPGVGTHSTHICVAHQVKVRHQHCAITGVWCLFTDGNAVPDACQAVLAAIMADTYSDACWDNADVDESLTPTPTLAPTFSECG